jgi:hypothetical protein
MCVCIPLHLSRVRVVCPVVGLARATPPDRSLEKSKRRQKNACYCITPMCCAGARCRATQSGPAQTMRPCFSALTTPPPLFSSLTHADGFAHGGLTDAGDVNVLRWCADQRGRAQEGHEDVPLPADSRYAGMAEATMVGDHLALLHDDRLTILEKGAATLKVGWVGEQ